jgi:hypothetical protein
MANGFQSLPVIASAEPENIRRVIERVNAIGVGRLNMTGYCEISVRSITADYTASDECLILANATAGNITVNLPAAANVVRRHYIVKKTDASGNTVTINPAGSETIDGAATKVLSTQYAVADFVCDGTSWHII